MKPSERIKELYTKMLLEQMKYPPHPLKPSGAEMMFNAILDYLDEVALPQPGNSQETQE